ncbi:MAG: methyltransferase domain-containing protein [Nocardioides sp.]
MSSHEDDRAFIGTVPDLYEALMVPMIFEQGAADLAQEIAALDPSDLLEIAAGTGVLTRAVVARCPGARIVATDLNEPMLAIAARTVPEGSNVVWKCADAQQLELADDSFDVVACQFGVMFFPDRPQAFAEARRVLRDGGTYALNTWDSLATNDFARVITEALVAAAPQEPLLFMERTPHGLHDEELLRSELAGVGFSSVTCEWVEGVSRSTAADAALAYCQGTPMRGMLDAHSSLDPETGTRLGAEALLARYGPGPIEGRIRWLRVLAS